jgi:hypothetical protein
VSTDDKSSAEVPTASESTASRLWRSVLIVLPEPIREAAEKGLLRMLVYLVLTVTVLPMVMAFLAAFWLSVIKQRVGLDFVQSLRNSYVNAIHEGFSIDELVARKLDYLQPIALHLQPNDPPVNFPIYLEPSQHAQIGLTFIHNNPPPDSAGCRFDDVERNTPLVTVRLGELDVLKCPTTAVRECSRTLDGAWWKKFGDSFSSVIPPLTVTLADGLSGKCVEVEIEGRVMVYKNVYQ